MASLTQIYQILSSIKNVSSIWQASEAIFDQITGQGEVYQALQQLNQLTIELIGAMDNIANQINDENLTQQWQTVSQTLGAAQLASASYALQFSQLTSNNTIPVNSTSYTFVQWCEGVPSQIPSAIQDMADQIANIWGLFVVGGVANPGVFQLWDELSAAAASVGSPQFVNQTNFNLQFQLMQEIYQIVASLYYTRETVLAYYYSGQFPIDETKNYQPLAEQINSQIGAVFTPNTVWGAFNTQLKSYLTPANNADPTPAQQWWGCTTTNDSYAGTDSFATIDEGHNQCTYFDPTITMIHEFPALGVACFSNIQICVGTYQSFDEGNYQYAYLTGTPVQIGANLQFTPAAPVTKFSAFDFNDIGIYFPVTGKPITATTTYPYLNSSFVTPPDPGISNDLLLVVTGFGFTTVGNRVGIQLYYATLDMSDPSTPAMAGDGMSEPNATSTGYFTVDGSSPDIAYIDTRPVGTADNFPMTNLTFVQTDGTGSGNRIGLAAQSAWPLYKISLLQPALALAPYVPPAPTQAAKARR